MIDVAIQHDSGTDPCTDRGIENVVVSASRAPAILCQCSGVTVVVNFDRQVVLVSDLFGERKVSPAWKIWRIKNDACLRIERSRSADADTPKTFPRRRWERIDGVHDGLERGIGRAMRHHGLTSLGENLALAVDKAESDFRSPDVNAEDWSCV